MRASSVAEKCRGIEILFLDVDGVLTDGSIVIDDRGIESKRFYVRDGSAIKWWQSAGRHVAVVSGRHAAAVEHRCRELGITLVRQEALDKLPAMREILAGAGLRAAQAAFVGDDLLDLPAMRVAGLSIAVADAAAEVRAAADHVTTASGGRGAVREAVEFILRRQGLWEGIVGRYSA